MVLFANNLGIVLNDLPNQSERQDSDSLLTLQSCFGIPDGRVSKLSDERDVLRAINEELRDPAPDFMIAFYTGDGKELFSYLKENCKWIEAAGGLCLKEKELLMIHRSEKWDFPKGKLDELETPHRAAVREVEEETGVSASILREAPVSYHFYPYKRQLAMKKTFWYYMTLRDDSDMQAQAEEDITEVGFFPDKKIVEQLKSSYASLKFLYYLASPELKQMMGD